LPHEPVNEYVKISSFNHTQKRESLMKKIIMLSLLSGIFAPVSSALAWGSGCCGTEEAMQNNNNANDCRTCTSYGKVERQCTSCNGDNLQQRCPDCPKNDK
jgi:hypothetical protein